MASYFNALPIGQGRVLALAALACFAITILVLRLGWGLLPQDQGRKFAVNGQLSKGKKRGAGVLFVPLFAVLALAFCQQSVELVIYLVLTVAEMASGYLDDAADKPWNEYKKGLIDLVIALAAGGTYINFNGTQVALLGLRFSLPWPVYLALAAILVWGSINCTNCTDGVDGLSTTVGCVSLATFALAFGQELGEYVPVTVVFIMVLLGYLWYNCGPSTLLMGDAGSRAIGFYLAILAMKSGHPMAYLLAALVFVVDGSLGIIKISLLRFCKIAILKNTRTPLHDHARKNCGWSDTQVVIRFTTLQILASALLLALAG